MSGISVSPRDEPDLGCTNAPLLPPGYGGGLMQEAASWDTPFQCPKFSRMIQGSAGLGGEVPAFHLVDAQCRERQRFSHCLRGSWPGNGVPHGDLGRMLLICHAHCCFVQRELRLVCSAWHRMPAQHKCSAGARCKARNFIPNPVASMQPFSPWLQSNRSPPCGATAHQLALPGHLGLHQVAKMRGARRAAPGR